MKQTYLVFKINNNGEAVGKINAFSSLKKAKEEKDYLNNLFKTCSYIIEKVIIK